MTSIQNLKTDPEKDLGGETTRDPEDARGPISADKPEDATKLEDSGPPDGGTAAWTVVLGAWCCSFSSPGWINSMCFPFSRHLLRFPL